MATSQPPNSPRSRQRQTQTQTQTQAPAPRTPEVPVLRLRGATREEVAEANGTAARRRIQWAEDVVDNEGMGRKSSKVCCIYHRPKGIDESSDESSSDSDDSDSGGDGEARPPRRSAGRDHNHDHHGHNHGHGDAGNGGKGKGRARSPNAYEKVPKTKSGGTKEK